MATSQPSRLRSFVPKPFRINNHRAAKIDLSAPNAIWKIQKNSKFAQLPEDILLLVMENLRENAKVNLIKTCRYLHRLLEFTLYTRLSPINPGDDHGEYRTGLLHRTLVGREDLIPCIRSYSGLLLPSPTQPPSKRNVIDRLWSRKGFGSINRGDTPITETKAFKSAVFVFSKACNITILEFTDRRDWTIDPSFEPIRTAVSKMPLVRLYIRICLHPTTVLRAQPELEHLEIKTCGHYMFTGLDKNDLPKLKSLRAPLRDASLIVPGSPVEELDLTRGYISRDDGLFKNLTLSTKPITKLSIRLFRPWRSERTRRSLQLISRNLRDIQHLTIVVAGCISEQVILDEIPSLQSLRSVTFRVANLATFPTPSESPTQAPIDTVQSDELPHQTHVLGDWDDLTTRLKTMCPFLVHVEHTPVREGKRCCSSMA